MKRAASFPIRRVAVMAVSLLALSACSKGRAPDVDAHATDVPDAIAGMQASPAQAEQGQRIGTPNKDRVVTLGVLNKRNNLSQDLVMKPGESRRMGNLVVKVATCDKTLPWERPEEEGAFVQVFVEERASTQEKLAWHKVFSGWLFKNSPALNVVQHPVYDVWVKKCDMHFPGEEAGSPAPASASNAPKPSGSESAAAPEEAPAAKAAAVAAPSVAPVGTSTAPADD